MPKNFDITSIINRIKFEYDVTQKEIAKRLGVSATYISDIINGRLPFTDQLREKLNKEFPESEMVFESSEQKGLPLIPIEAVAGFGSQQFPDLPVEGFYQIAEFSTADFLVRVKGDSMTPKYNAGDIIACKKVNDLLFFQWGRVYVVDTKSQGMMVKRVRQSTTEEKIRLVSENPDYDPFDIPRSDINAVSLVMGAITLE